MTPTELKALIREHLDRHNRVPAGPVEALLRYVGELESRLDTARQIGACAHELLSRSQGERREA